MNIQTSHIHQGAPAKPNWGEPCNGCGVCCLAEPCPVSQILFLRRTGPCQAILWQAPLHRYQCGMVIAPSRFHALLPAWGDRLLARLFSRWIASGKGCDSSASIAEDEIDCEYGANAPTTRAPSRYRPD